MKKLFLIFALGANAYLNAQGWVGNSSTNTIYPVNSALGTIPINVGIGTNAPSAQLHTTSSVRFQGLTNSDTPNRIIVQDVSGNLFWRNASTLGGANNWSLIGNLGTNPATNFVGTRDNQRLVFRTNNTEKMTILANGRVGINNTVPDAQLLHIGNGSLAGLTGTNANQNAFPIASVTGDYTTFDPQDCAMFSITHSGAPGINRGGSLLLGGRYGSGVNGPAAFARLRGLKSDTFNGRYGGYLAFDTRFHDGTSNNWTLLERMRITSTGNVGIGTSTPNTRLEVAGITTLTNNSTSDVGATINASISGIRMNGLRSTTPTIPNPGSGLLSVDADGDVILVNGGNSAINNLTCNDFIGSADDINFRTNNSLQMKLNRDGNLIMNEGNQIMFGSITDCNTTPNWSIENWDNGLNFYKPFPSVNSGNYKLFLSENNDQVGVGIGNTPSWGRSLNWNWERFQVNGWGLADGWAIFSDERLKSNFRPISNPLNALMSINTYIYDYSKDQFDNVSNDSIVKKPISSGLTNRYGFKAQEVEKIFPDLVHSPVNESGYKSMDYIGFVPIIIEAFKELNAKVEKQNNAVVENEELKAKIAKMEEKFALLEKTITQLCESGCEGLKKAGSSSDADVLYQSIPNPTDSEALINYHLSREYRDAFITVSSQDGKQLMSVKLDTKKGAGSVKISLGDLANGTYLYTLVAGERVIDTKRLQIIK